MRASRALKSLKLSETFCVQVQVTFSFGVGHAEDSAPELLGLNAPGEVTVKSEALDSAILSVRHTHLVPLLGQRQTMRNVEAVWSPGHSEWSRASTLAPLHHPAHLVTTLTVHTHTVLDHSAVAVAITHEEAPRVLTDCHRRGFTEVIIIRAWDKPLTQGDQRSVVSATVRRKLEHLVQSHVSQPDIVLGVDSDHVGQEEHVVSPLIEDVSGSVDCQHSIVGDGNILVQPECVVPTNMMYSILSLFDNSRSLVDISHFKV